MPLIIDLTQLLMQEEVECTDTPVHNLLWACYERALRDLDVTDADDNKYARDALAWLRHSKAAKPRPFSFAWIIEHCKPSAKLLQLTAEKVRKAEERLRREQCPSLRSLLE